ncbi:THAP domain-containing protein 10 isoform X2 [Dermacentor silvarum]|uniref:THAP domain-containing protein 10 isoform X2 n=1 Tax=Dermacentor silvarum TaxID=543639 RepID=UPI002101037B|nr:THAP domain-containing protein 10 isoform X2 [Dermacentor silvarum]
MAPRYCVVKSCGKKEGDNVVFHYFPSDDDQRKAWTEFVQAVRGTSWMPGRRSQVCSLHFSSDCYVYNMQYCADFGLPTRRKYLNKGSVPTLYPAGAVFISAPPTGPGTETGTAVGIISSDSWSSGSCIHMCSAPSTGPPLGPTRNYTIMASVAVATLPMGQVSAITQCSLPLTVKSTQAMLSKRRRNVGVQAEVKTKTPGCTKRQP